VDLPTADPNLKGLHLTSDVWCPEIDEEGWRVTHADLETSKEIYEEIGMLEKEEDTKEDANKSPPQ
jgi:hypothetical protein